MLQLIDIPELESKYLQLAESLFPLAVHFYDARRSSFPQEDPQRLFFDSVVTLGRYFLEQNPAKNPSLELYLEYSRLVGERVGMNRREESRIPEDKLEILVRMAGEYEQKVRMGDVAAKEELTRQISNDQVLLNIYDLHWGYIAMKMIGKVLST